MVEVKGKYKKGKKGQTMASGLVRLLAILIALSFSPLTATADGPKRASKSKKSEANKRKAKKRKKSKKRRKGKNKKGREEQKKVVELSPQQLEVEQLVAAGLRFAADKQLVQALAEFERAYELGQDPAVLLHMARAYRQTGDFPKALSTYEEFLSSGEGKVEPQLLEVGRGELEELKALPGRLQIASIPEGAQVTLDGKPIGKTPLPDTLTLSAGSHELRATLDGYEPSTKTLEVKRGGSLAVTLKLTKPGLAMTSADGGISKSAPERSKASGSTRSIALRGGFGSNLRLLEASGAPSVGISYSTGRLSFVLDGVLIAYAAIPQVRYRIFGDLFSLHLLAGAPVSYDKDLEESIFAAGAAGLAVELKLGAWLSLHVDAMASYAGAKHGLTVPTFAGGALRF